MKNFSDETINAAVSLSVEDMKSVSAEFPARKPASLSEKNAAERLKEQLEKCSDEVVCEEFAVAPAAATGWVYFTIVCAIMAYVTYFFVSFLSVLFVLAAIVPFVVSGLLCLPVFDGMYVTRTSQNVTAVKKCAGDRRRRVVIAAHVDAAPVSPLKSALGGKAVAVVCSLAVVGLLYVFAADVARWVYLGSMGSGMAGGAYLYTGIVGIIFVPVWFACFFVFGGNKTADGVCDNLSGCYTALALLRALGESDCTPENTEIAVVITGAEECGMRGAAAWCDAHKDEDKSDTVVIALDTVCEEDKFAVSLRELNGLVATDAALADDLAGAAGAAGVICEKRAFSYGATDAVAFARAGYRAASLTASDAMPEYIHTPRDNADCDCAGAMRDAVRVLAEFIRATDGGHEN